MVKAQVPVAGLNSSQLASSPKPPQARRLSWECAALSIIRLEDIRHLVEVEGWNTSTDLKAGWPPVIRMAAKNLIKLRKINPRGK